MTRRASRIALRAAASFALLLALSAVAPAQTPVYAWSFGIGGTSGDEARGVAFDAAGNEYVTGVFAGTVDFGGGPITSQSSADVFLAKYTPGGAHVWSRGFGGTLSDGAKAIAVAPDGRIAITGTFGGTADFGGAAPLVSTGTVNVFVACYDTDGVHLWSRGFGAAAAGNDGRAVAMDDAGNVVVTGFAGSPVDFGGGALTGAGSAELFLARYDAAGAHVWSWLRGGTGEEIGNGVALDDDGSVVLAGEFNGTTNLGGANLTSAGSDDIFVARYDASGAHQWSRRFGNVQFCLATDVDVDSGGNAVVIGKFTGVVDFGGGSINGSLGSNILLAKYDANGDHVWSQGLGASGTSDYGYGVAVDRWDRIHLTGYFEGTADFGGGPITSGGQHDVLVARYDASGAHEWSVGFGTTGYQEGRAVAVDAGGNVAVAGMFANVVDFGDGWILSNGGNDAFLLKFDGDSPTAAGPSLPAPGAPALVARPNPFRAATTIAGAAPRRGSAVVTIHDARGARIATLPAAGAAGSAPTWNGRDDAGRRVPAGVYFARVADDAGTRVVKLVRLD